MTAESSNFFLSFEIFFYIEIFLSIAFFSFQLLRIATLIPQKDPIYQEYQNFFKNKKRNPGGNFFISIKAKLIPTFSFLILFIIILLSYWVLKDYKKTITNAVSQNGTILSEQSARFYLANMGDDIEIQTYLYHQKEKNQLSTIQFKSITFFKRSKAKDSTNPIFKVKFSTDKKQLNKKLPNKLLKEYTITNSAHGWMDKNKGLFHFISPIYLSKKLIGFSVVKYTETMIFKTYFKTKIKVILIAIAIMYATVFLVYILGTSIVMPILFLQMGVKKISIALSELVSGESKPTSHFLQYEETVKSRDEVKQLSTEVRGMVDVIKGIIPYVSMSTLQQANNSGKKSTTKKNLAYLFTDIRGFTTLCEGLSPQKVVDILNSYLEMQTNIIIKNKGDVDKFMGDCVMATFDGENKELNALNAAFEIKIKMAEERERRISQNLTAIDIGIGIHSGEVIFGSIGAQDRMDFTSIGDTVNLASRLEGANKFYQTKNLISETVYKKTNKKYLCREIDYLTVKGKNKPVTIYEMLTLKKGAKKTIKELAKNFKEALVLYRNRKWKTAMRKFQKNSNEYEDGVSQIFYKRCELFVNNPPPKDWDGVFNMTSK